MARYLTVTTLRRVTINLLCICLVLVAQLCSAEYAVAANGQPDTLKFGYGARLDAEGKEANLAIAASASIGLDWIGIDFNWALWWPKPEGVPNLQLLDQLAKAAHKNGLNLLLSITNPPEWALGDRGPDPEITASLVEMLAKRYQGTLLAIEPFPEANTAAGWGAAPQPEAYAALLAASWDALKQINSPITLVAGGLRNLPVGQNDQDIDDLSFLAALYDAGARELMPVISLHLANLSGTAISAPATDTAVLRRYELIREVMLKNNHNQGKLWITSFSWPRAVNVSLQEQSTWIAQAYQLMRSQLYIGSAFFDQLNPVNPATDSAHGSIIYRNDHEIRIHPALLTLAQLITLDRSGQLIPLQAGFEKLTSVAGLP